eukprot:scaffold1700_cov129-Skeletonema_dohrnii-CCMP3373.AAC.22
MTARKNTNDDGNIMKLCGRGGRIDDDGALLRSVTAYVPANFSGTIQRYSGYLLKAASTECASARGVLTNNSWSEV